MADISPSRAFFGFQFLGLGLYQITRKFRKNKFKIEEYFF